MRLFLVLLTTYLIGSIPIGYLIARYTKKMDIRKYGSGNIGATNVLRVVGKSAALVTLVLDVLKGFIVVTFWADIVYSYKMGISYQQMIVMLGFCVVLGHVTSVFLEFKGGKGVATSLGVMLAICPKLLLIGLCVWLIVFLITKIVSISSICAAFVIPFASYMFDYPVTMRFMLIGLSALIIIKHKSNMGRLIRKEERKWSVRI